MTNEAVRWLRVSYWVGAVVDFGAGLMMLIPSLFTLMNQPVNFQAGDEYRYAMGMGAPLMFGWTALLLWADRKPVMRKGILPITLLVVLGEAITQTWGVMVNFVPLGALVPTFILQAVIVLLFLFAYFKARRIE